MGEAIGIRFDDDTLKKIDEISEDDDLDRSSAVRKLVNLGYSNHMKKKAIEQYRQGQITLSKAAHLAKMTLWEMEKALVESGYKSEYSVEDLKNEMKSLR
jgi:predicted HTH domain antitoxin